jgi:hypothetical protein
MGFFGSGASERMISGVKKYPGLQDWLRDTGYEFGQLGPSMEDIEGARGVAGLPGTFDAAAREKALREGFAAQQSDLSRNVFQTLKEQLGTRGSRLHRTGRGQLVMAEAMTRQMAPQRLALEQSAQQLHQFGSQAEQARRNRMLQAYLGAGGLGAQRGQLSLQEMIGVGLPQFATFAPMMQQRAADPGFLGKMKQLSDLGGSIFQGFTGLGGVGGFPNLGGLLGGPAGGFVPPYAPEQLRSLGGVPGLYGTTTGSR